MNQLKTILQSKIFYLIIIIITLNYVVLRVKIFEYESIYQGDETTFVGTISKIKSTDYGYSLTLKGKEKLIFYQDENNYQLGDLVKITGELKKANNNTVLNNFNYKEYLSQNKIFYILDRY